MWDKKVLALYIRLSEEDRDVTSNENKVESDSVTNQRALLHHYIDFHDDIKGMKVVEYIDDGQTGTVFTRPKYEEMMADVRKGLIGVIVFKDLSRMGRNYIEMGYYLDKVFPAYDVRVISVNEQFDTKDYPGQTSGIDISIKNVVNELYSKDISIKNKSAMRTRMRHGEHISGYVFYGYVKSPTDRHKIIIDDEAAQVVRSIFQLSVEGNSTYKIANKLNKEGILCPYEYKKAKKNCKLNHTLCNDFAMWGGGTVKQIIRDERYTGKMISHRHESTKVGSKKVHTVPKEEWIIVEDTHEAIISKELFDAANQALSERILRGGWKGSLPRTNLFTCPYCNHKLSFTGEGKARKYISCRTSVVNQSNDCARVHVEREKIEQTVVSTLNTMGQMLIDKMKTTETGKDEVGQLEKEIKSYRNKLDNMKEKRRNEYLKLKEGKINKETYLTLMEDSVQLESKLNNGIEEYKEKIKHLREKASKSDEVLEGAESLFQINCFGEVVKSGLLSAIYIDNKGDIEIMFKNKDFMDLIG